MLYDLIIIGAGAAGLFAAANAHPDRRVLLLEKTDRPGQKLLLTGNGQCNLTNIGDISAFLIRYGPQGKRLRPVLYPFSNLALMAWLEDRDLTLIARPDGKVFPASLDAHDVLNLFLKHSRQNGVEIRPHTPVTALMRMDGTDAPHHFRVETRQGPLSARHVLVTTGGTSYPHTGSDGCFFACLESLGIELTPRRPALAPVYVHGYPYGGLSGISFSNCAITIGADPKPIRTAGSLLLTHRGLSGPVILNNARSIDQGTSLTVNYLPGTNATDFRRALIEASVGSARQIITLLEAQTDLPRRFVEAVCDRANIPAHTKAAHLGGPDMTRFATLLTTDTYTVSGTGGFTTAMATAGGVSLDEIDLHTMEVRRCPGLHLAGEVLDVDGDTGGYNLQFAFSSAKRAMDAILDGGT